MDLMDLMRPLPQSLDSVAQPFTTLECGKAYLITAGPDPEPIH